MPHLNFMLRAEIQRPLMTCGNARRFLSKAITACGMNIINGPHAVQGTVSGNEGVSGSAILDFSHAALHEWPWWKPAVLRLDIYTCGAIVPTVELISPLLKPLRATRISTMLVDCEAMDVLSTTDEWVP